MPTNKIGFPKEAIGKEVIFMYEGEKLDAKANDPLKSVLRRGNTVTIYDQGNMIGKLINNTGFSTFNMMNPNINNDFTKYNPNSSEITELIPRNPEISIDDRGYIINITFLKSTGSRVNILMNSNKTIENLCKEYANKIGLPVGSLGNVRFLYNGSQLDYKTQTTIGNMFRNSSIITVYKI